MSQPPETPRTPAEIKAWVESLSPDAVQNLALSMIGGFGLARGTGVSDSFDVRNPPIDLPPPPSEPVLLTVRVSLEDTQPEVWRRLSVPGDLDLARVHDALQQAMGWTDSHLHRFSLGDPYVSPRFLTAHDLDEGDEGTPLETDVRLDQVLREPGDELTYEYDFGDGWTHTSLESVDPCPARHGGSRRHVRRELGGIPHRVSGGGARLPSGGRRRRPGLRGVAAWVRGGEDQRPPLERTVRRRDARVAAGGVAPRPLRRRRGHGRAGAHRAPRHRDRDGAAAPRGGRGHHPALDRCSVRGRRLVAAPGWDEAATFTAEEAASLTTPYRAVLEAVGDGLTLTAAGYLPPRAVETIYRRSAAEGEWIGKGNREDLTLPVLDLRERCRRYGLIRKAKGRLLPTANGRRLRADSSALLDLVLTRLAHEGEDFERVATGLALLGVVVARPSMVGSGG